MNRILSLLLSLIAVTTSAFAATACQSETANAIGIDPVNQIAYLPMYQLDQNLNAQLAVVSLVPGAFPPVLQTISLPGAGGVFSIAYNPLNQTMLVGALLSGTSIVAVYVINTGTRTLAAGSPIGTTILGGIGIVMDPVRNRAIVSGSNSIGVLDTSTTPTTFVAGMTASSTLDAMTINQTTGLLVTSGNNSLGVIDTTQALPWTESNFLPSGLPVTIGNGIAFDPSTNLALFTPSGYRDVTEAINFATLSLPSGSVGTADYLTVPGLGEGQNTIGGGPGGWVAVNCVTHQGAVVDPGGQNIKLVQLPSAPIAGTPDNNGQPYTSTTADASSAYTIADALLGPDPCGAGMTTGGGTGNQEVNVDPTHNQLYVKTGVGAVNTVQYLVDVDLSSPVVGACPANAYKNGPDTGAPCSAGQWTPAQTSILLPGPTGCVNGRISVQLGQYQGAALGATFAKSLEVEVLTSTGAAATGDIVTFSAPATGASGTFTTTDTNVATATVNAQGVATAPPFVANNTVGGYLVTVTVNGYSTPAYFDMTNLANSVSVTIQTSPPGLLVSLDGGAAAAAPITQSLAIDSVHSITTQSPQTVGGVRYGWQNWSDGQAQTHEIVILGSATYTATFLPSYPLTISTSPGGAGTYTPTSGNYYNQGTAVPITATGINGYAFTGWTGNVASPSSASTTVTMNGPETVVANFTLPTFTISPSSATVSAAATTGSVAVTASVATGGWTAVSNSSFLTITSGATGTGNGTVGYSVAANTATSSRTGTMTIAGQTFTVTQSAATSGLGFFAVTPCRVADTRIGQGFSGQFGPPSMTAGQTRTFTIPASACNIPATAQAYSLNVTVVPAATLGYLTIWPAGQAQPYVSTLNSLNGAILANAALVPAGAQGAVSVYVTDATDLIVDINGYFAPPAPSSLAFYPVTPCRVADTRNANGPFGGPSLAAGGTRSFTVPQSACNIPATAQAYSLNMTAVPPGPLTYLTTWPTGQNQPYVSTLNALQGQIAANAAIVPAGTNGAISVFVSDPTNVIVDINGYFAPPAAGALYFYPVTPCRIADTRNANGTFGGPSLAAGGTRTFPIQNSSCGLPSTAQAYSLNMTVVPSGSLLYLSTWPAGQVQPVVSTLNDVQGQVVANAAIVPAGSPSGGISVFAFNATNLVIDVNGYFGQ